VALRAVTSSSTRPMRKNERLSGPAPNSTLLLPGVTSAVTSTALPVMVTLSHAALAGIWRPPRPLT
jgi:hypothetical protein